MKNNREVKPEPVGYWLAWAAALILAWPCVIPTVISAQEVSVPSGVVGADQDGALPLWEAGMVGFATWNADYPASDENHVNALGLPFVIYRGDILRLGDGSLARGRFIKTDRIEFDVSFNGSFPVDSDDNDARKGMPDLDYLGGIGPQLTITLLPGKPEIHLALPVRAVFSSDLSDIEFRGIVINPKLMLQHQNIFDTGTRLNLNAGPVFATTELMAYFYGVEPQFVRPDRPAFDAGGGYLGTELNLGISKLFTDRLRGFAGGKLGHYGGSANEDSPLHRRNTNFSFWLGLSWAFYQSDRKEHPQSSKFQKSSGR